MVFLWGFYESAKRLTYEERDDPAYGFHHRCRFVSEMALNESNAALQVNVINCQETAKVKTQHVRWQADLCVNKVEIDWGGDDVVIVDAARAMEPGRRTQNGRREGSATWPAS